MSQNIFIQRNKKRGDTPQISEAVDRRCTVKKVSFKISPPVYLYIIKIDILCAVMQTWISPYMFVFIWKQYFENFGFLILRTLDLVARESCKFLKN